MLNDYRTRSLFLTLCIKLPRTNMQKQILKSSEVGDFVANLIADTAKQSVKERGVFTLGESSIIQYLGSHTLFDIFDVVILIIHTIGLHMTERH